MKKISRQLLMTNLKKTYLKKKVYLTLQIKFQTLINLKQKELINKYNKRKTFQDVQLAEIIKVLKKKEKFKEINQCKQQQKK